MFYDTFSGTLGFAVAIGIVFLVVMYILKNTIWKKLSKKDDEQKKNEKTFLSRINPKAINKVGGRLLICTSVFFAFGFIPSCFKVAHTSHKEPWVWVLVPGEIMVLLSIALVFLIFIVIMTYRMDRFEYKVLDDE